MRTSRCVRGVITFAVFFQIAAGCTLEIYEQTQKICGNARLDPGEVCDDGNTADGDGCSHDCSIEACGNGIQEPELGEICDDGNTVGGDGCSHDCMSTETCGNHITDLGEVCDDGNTVDGDGCSRDCTSNETCGNGLRDLGEVCDTGGASAACDPDCTLPECGDGLVNMAAGEQCDDGPGNGTNGDPCKINCTLVP